MRKALIGLILPACLALPGLALAEDPRVELLEAIIKDDVSTVQRLLHEGVNPNVREAERGPAVVMAASEKSYGSLEELASEPGTELESTNDQGETALMVVSRLGHLPSVETLLSRGAIVNRDGWSPLHLAAANGHLKVVRKLIKARANIDSKSANGTTPMMMAARMGQITTYQELLKAGADPTVINDADLSAVDYLEQHGDPERAQLLRDYIKKWNGEKVATPIQR